MEAFRRFVQAVKVQTRFLSRIGEDMLFEAIVTELVVQVSMLLELR